ncbi:MAG TPA: class I SAM-dependent methyltransferase [Allosphingosinicella sp.]|jgi:SAM-dependent methyltransferase
MSEAWIWDQYWHSDRVASCFDGRGATNYGDAVASGWRSFFGSLPEGAAILDLCSGNGAVAILAAEAARDFRIVAVDQADIDPAAHVTRFADCLAAIRFMGGVNVEALPFADASFDVAVSQYGIEYSDLGRSIPELWRVLRPAGRARLVLHAAEGEVARWSAPHVGDADFLLGEIDLCGKASLCFAAVAAAERDPEVDEGKRRAAEAALAAFADALHQAGRYLPGAADPPMIRHSAATLLDAYRNRGRFERDQLEAVVDSVRSGIEAHRGRVLALLAAAVTAARAEEIAAGLRARGADAASFGLTCPQGLIGHVVELRRPGE